MAEEVGIRAVRVTALASLAQFSAFQTAGLEAERPPTQYAATNAEEVIGVIRTSPALKESA